MIGAGMGVPLPGSNRTLYPPRSSDRTFHKMAYPPSVAMLSGSAPGGDDCAAAEGAAAMKRRSMVNRASLVKTRRRLLIWCGCWLTGPSDDKRDGRQVRRRGVDLVIELDEVLPQLPAVLLTGPLSAMPSVDFPDRLEKVLKTGARVAAA